MAAGFQSGASGAAAGVTSEASVWRVVLWPQTFHGFLFFYWKKGRRKCSQSLSMYLVMSLMMRWYRVHCVVCARASPSFTSLALFEILTVAKTMDDRMVSINGESETSLQACRGRGRSVGWFCSLIAVGESKTLEQGNYSGSGCK